MKYLYTTAALFAAAVSVAANNEGCTNDGGNWYCKQVNAITYQGVGGNGKYNKVTSMDANSGTCSSTPQGYSGSMSPLNEELSMHFRGPLNLKQFAVYTPGDQSSSKKAKARRSATERRHAHAHAHSHHHLHQHQSDIKKRNVGDMVIATINGEVVSWANDFGESGDKTAAPAEATAKATTAATAAAAAETTEATMAAPKNRVNIAGLGGDSSDESSAKSSDSPATTPSSDSSSGSSSSDSSSSSGSNVSGSWGRQHYFNAGSGTQDGLTLLNHNGGSGSGVFDYSFGNSLSYSSSDGKSGSASPEVFSGNTIGSSDEVIFMSDDECQGDSCGYVRDGTVAYHGFAGQQKAFFFEFEMPDDGKSGASQYDPVNMPAIWMLNAQIPRTLQYGNADCSCWTSGCGEFDIMEVLAPGDKRCKSTLHGNIAGGDSNYFQRPMSGPMKIGVVLDEDQIHIKVLENSFDFSGSLSPDDIKSICETEDTAGGLYSIFNLAQ
ncbi:hypothetical protein MBLNU230_g4940t1 [Neophaeotheca triangularis]